uniref:hypothetical protein n=1 Tax=Thaumasiovibrio occultus TaxID=1891184 RepID=UPI000B350B8D|nr:hypothetical protein [Thaumasiovibrio occultus]
MTLYLLLALFFTNWDNAPEILFHISACIIGIVCFSLCFIEHKKSGKIVPDLIFERRIGMVTKLSKGKPEWTLPFTDICAFQYPVVTWSNGGSYLHRYNTALVPREPINMTRTPITLTYQSGYDGYYSDIWKVIQIFMNVNCPLPIILPLVKVLRNDPTTLALYKDEYALRMINRMKSFTDEEYEKFVDPRSREPELGMYWSAERIGEVEYSPRKY